MFKHVVYVIRENRTYDQVFGDMKEGDGESSLCTFGEKITPNAHALAREFTLLDNFYCNGICSADGHSWATEGNTTANLERAVSSWPRSYPFGDDALNTSSTGFLWDEALAAKKSFLNLWGVRLRLNGQQGNLLCLSQGALNRHQYDQVQTEYWGSTHEEIQRPRIPGMGSFDSRCAPR